VPLEVVDYTSSPEDSSTEYGRSTTSSEAQTGLQGRSSEFFRNPMKNPKGGRLRLPLKIGADPKNLNLSKTPLGIWDALTSLEAVDCTSLPEDASTQDERKITSSKALTRPLAEA
jgi:hypothetical protein